MKYIIEVENGYFLFKLYNLMDEKKISINKLMQDTQTDFKVIQRLGTGNLVRIDIFVLARLCDYFQCSIEDLIEYRKK